MGTSNFRYKLCEPTGRAEPFSKCSHGIYYKAAKKLPGEDNEQEYSECVIKDYGNNIDHVMSQIKLSEVMGNEYALEVLHIDNTDESNVKVIYPVFEDTLSTWLGKLVIPDAEKFDEWMQDEVFPKIRKLWRLLLELQDKLWDKKIVINHRCCMPLIEGVPKLLYFDEDGEKNEEDRPDENNLKLDYPIKVLDRLLTGLTSDGSYTLPKNIEEAREYLNSNSNSKPTWNKSELLQHYGLLSAHPVFYHSDEKSRFLQLFYDITFKYKLSGWLNKELHWVDFRGRINLPKTRPSHMDEKSWEDFQRRINAYQSTLHYNSGKSQGRTQSTELGARKRKLDDNKPSSSHACDQGQSDHDPLSSDQGQSDQESHSSKSNQNPPYYHQGSDIIRFTRNVLTHFNENYKDTQGGGHLAGGDIVETVDRDLAVCSLYYKCAKIIITNQPPQALMKNRWVEHQKFRWEELKNELGNKEKTDKCKEGWKEVEVISQAYQPGPLQFYVKFRDQTRRWMKAKEIFKPRLYTPGHWMEADEILKPVNLYTLEDGACKLIEADEILGPLQLYTDMDWKEATKIFKPIELELWTNRPGNWMKAKEVLSTDVNVVPRLKLWTKGAWKADWKDVGEIKRELNQPLELETRKLGGREEDTCWKDVEEIKNGLNPEQTLIRVWTFDQQKWLTPKQIFNAASPWKLASREGGIEAFEDERPMNLMTYNNWDGAKKKLKDFFKSLK